MTITIKVTRHHINERSYSSVQGMTKEEAAKKYVELAKKAIEKYGTK